ncbi:histidine kinase dimerization/phosphoacceptor domain -containing protein, partial [Methanobacterium sp.]|uniref:histidine kinase dimerization/phosphoacceptor domain -containing protein n=1 Tax=Methanobacterium sp. TaxID=2164 RepID=UPI003C74A9F5
MNPYAFISLLSSIIALLLGNFIYYRNPNNRLNKLIAIICLLVTYLAFVEYGMRQSETLSAAYFWLKASSLWPFLMPILLIIVLEVTKRINILKNKIFIILLFTPSIIIFLISFLTNQLNNGLVLKYWGWNEVLSTNILLLSLTSIWIISLGIATIIIGYTYYRKSIGMEKVQILYILTGLTVVLILSLITELILPVFSINFPELTYTSASLGLIFISYGVANYRLPSLTPTIAANEIVANISNFMVITDCSKHINYINPVGLKLLGYNENEIIGSDLNIIIPLDGVIGSKETYNQNIEDFETLLKLKNGFSIPILLSKSFISKKSNIMGILYVGTDISERKAIENKKRAVTKQTIKRQNVLLELYKEDFSILETTLKHLTETVSKTLNIDRVSLWFFNEDKSILNCSDLYKLNNNIHEKESNWNAKDYPIYIQTLETHHNITAEDTLTNPYTKELKEDYIKPNGIISMLNVPIWLQKEMVGVLSMEQTENSKAWTFEEQDFAASVSYILSLTLEASKRDKAQKQIIKSLEEKDVLLREIHHRVKNNMQIISSLLSLQSSNIENPEMKDIFSQSQNRVKSMSMIHEQLYQTDDLSKIDFKSYVNGLIKSLFQIYSSNQKQIE